MTTLRDARKKGKLGQFVREHEKGARRSPGITTSSAYECEVDAPHVVGVGVNRIGTE